MPQEHVLNVSSKVISLHYFPINKKIKYIKSTLA